MLWRGESSCAGTKVVCNEFFAHFGWARSHSVQPVVAHIQELLSSKPPIMQHYHIRRRDASITRQLVSTGILCRKASSSICLTRKSATSTREMNPHVQ